MYQCPNNNKAFDKSLSFLFDKNLSPEDMAYQRRRVYYTVCVLIRLAIAGLLLQLKDKVWVPYIVAVVSLYSIYSLGFVRKQDNQWWSNRFQLMMAILLFVDSVLIIFKVRKVPTWTMALLFFISIFGGVFQSLLIKSC